MVKKIIIFLFVIAFLPTLLLSESINKIGSAENFGRGGVSFEDSGFSAYLSPSLAVFNKNYLNVVGTANFLYSNIEDINLKNFTAGVEFKNKKKWAVSGVGEFLKIDTYQDIFAGISGSCKLFPFLSIGAGYNIDQISSSYESFSKLKMGLVSSVSYHWSFLLLSVGGSLNNFLFDYRNFSFFGDAIVNLGFVKIGLNNAFVNAQYLPALGMDYKLNSHLVFRAGLKKNEMSLGIGFSPVRSMILDYAILLHQDLGYSHLVDIKFFM